MKQILVAVALVMVGLMPGVSQAATIFIDDFNNEVRGLDHTFADKWTVLPGGTVDMIGYAPAYFNFPSLPSDQRYVDLDGTTGSVGTMVSSAFALLAGTTYDLTFDLAGSQRGDTNTMSNYGIDTNGDNVADISGALLSRISTDLFSTVTVNFTTVGAIANAHIIFAQQVGNNNNVGMVLDNVALISKVAAVPEPASLMLLGAGLAAIGIWRRKAAR
jgi:hypothetical protein